MLRCLICGHEEKDWLADHLQASHGLTPDEYVTRHPKAPTVSKRLLDRFDKDLGKVERKPPVPPEDLCIELADIPFPVHLGVPESACLPMPVSYRLPKHGELGMAVIHALVTLYDGRSLYVHGLPGSGKDALFHAWSALTRRPAIIRQVQPGSDIEGWFFSRAFNEHGTLWEEGDVLRALRDGYLTEDGRRIPYLVLISDFDRADRAQAEYLRLVTDSITKRVQGPGGVVYNVLPGTLIVATANTAGAGDPRGRMVSSNPIDASILDRFDAKVKFHWLDWEDEEPIVRAKFPRLEEKVPHIFTVMGRLTVALRTAIMKGSLYTEFSHRALCGILAHADTLLRLMGNEPPSQLLRRATRVWLDGLPDDETMQAAVKILDTHMQGGLLDEGDTRHISKKKPKF